MTTKLNLNMIFRSKYSFIALYSIRQEEQKLIKSSATNILFFWKKMLYFYIHISFIIFYIISQKFHLLFK